MEEVERWGALVRIAAPSDLERSDGISGSDCDGTDRREGTAVSSVCVGGVALASRKD